MVAARQLVSGDLGTEHLPAGVSPLWGLRDLAGMSKNWCQQGREDCMRSSIWLLAVMVLTLGVSTQAGYAQGSTAGARAGQPSGQRAGAPPAQAADRKST